MTLRQYGWTGSTKQCRYSTRQLDCTRTTTLCTTSSVLCPSPHPEQSLTGVPQLLTRSTAQTTPHEHLDKVKIQITIQPIIPSEKGTIAPFPLRTQTLVLLASNTLQQFKDNIRAGGDAIPVQKAEREDEQNSEEDEPMEEKEKVVRWGEERSNPGSCLVFDGLIYADEAEGRTNYTESVLLIPLHPLSIQFPAKLTSCIAAE